MFYLSLLIKEGFILPITRQRWLWTVDALERGSLVLKENDVNHKEVQVGVESPEDATRALIVWCREDTVFIPLFSLETFH